MHSEPALISWRAFLSEQRFSNKYTWDLNCDVEVDNCALGDEVSELWKSFIGFLNKKGDSVDGLTAHLRSAVSPKIIIDDFVNSHADIENCSGYAVIQNERRLTTQSNFGTLAKEEWTQVVFPSFASATTPIGNLLANFPRVNETNKLNSWLASFRNKVKNLTKDVTDDEWVGESSVTDWEPSVGDFPKSSTYLWATFDDWLNENLQIDSDVASWGDDEHHGSPSYNSALQRYICGLSHGSDHVEDPALLQSTFNHYEDFVATSANVSEKEAEKFMRLPAYKVLMKLDFEPINDDVSLSQPNSFSNGYDDLFMSHRPDSKMGGRACRLERVGCKHVDCKCGKSGAPEVLVKISELKAKCQSRVHVAVAIRPEHLRKFKKPSITLIKEQRGL